MSSTAVSDIGGPGHDGPRVYSAILDPVVGNDLSIGHQIGDIIVNTVTGIAFICISAASGAAVWRANNVMAVKTEWTAAEVSKTFFVAPRACTVIGITARVEAAGTDGSAVTGTVVKVASGTAVALGTNLSTGTINLKGTAATNQVLALSATASVLAVAAGTALGIVFAGTLTVASGSVTVLLIPS